MKYMIWNNKGGVGKTFVTYLLSTEYAEKHHDDTDVVVVDLCPQANVSEILLGGNGSGETNLNHLYENERTIASYIKSRYDKSRFGKMGTEISYFVKVNDYNKHMPDNLYLLPGDTDLDICSSIINYLAQAPEKNAWAKSRGFISDLVKPLEDERKPKRKNVLFFFDCNPSFSNYTEMAVISADRIIIPCTADSASIRGIHNLFRMIYGIEIFEDKQRLDDSVFDTFISKAKEAGLPLPKVHMFVQNKLRVLDKKPSTAFTAHIAEIDKIANKTKNTDPSNFTKNSKLVVNLKDGNTLASIVNHSGLPLSKIQETTYIIYGKRTKANQSQIESLRKDVKCCVDLLST